MTFALQTVAFDGSLGATVERGVEGWIVRTAVNCVCEKFKGFHQVAVIDEATGKRVATFERDYDTKRNAFRGKWIAGRKSFR